MTMLTALHLYSSFSKGILKKAAQTNTLKTEEKQDIGTKTLRDRVGLKKMNHNGWGSFVQVAAYMGTETLTRVMSEDV